MDYAAGERMRSRYNTIKVLDNVSLICSSFTVHPFSKKFTDSGFTTFNSI